MYKLSQKIFGWIIAILAGIFSVLKLAIWLVGLSTTIEDSEALPEKGKAILKFIAEQPSITLYGVFVMLGLLGLWLALQNRGEPLSTRNDAASNAGHRLHLRLYQSSATPASKAYIVQWSPRVYFDMRFVELENNVPGRTDSDDQPTLYILNSGPGSVRHVEIEWSLNEDMGRLIRSSEIFGSALVDIDGDKITIAANGAAVSRPLRTSQTEIIPKIREDEIARHNAPKNFRWVWGARMLAETKLFSEVIPKSGDAPMLDLINRTDFRRLFTITLKYEPETGVSTMQVFDVTGWIHPHVATHSFERSPQGMRGEIEPGGITAMIHNVMLSEREC